MKNIQIDVRGTSALLMNNAEGADPLNQFAKELKKVSGKTKKTEEDHILMSDIEWRKNLYWNDELGVHIPAENLASMIAGSMRLSKQGKQSIHILVDDDMPLAFKNSKNLDRLAHDPAMRKRANVKNGMKTVQRTRPQIPSGWTGTIKLLVDVDGIDPDQVVDFVKRAGHVVGLGDWRPSSPKPGRFGRFEVVEVRQ